MNLFSHVHLVILQPAFRLHAFNQAVTKHLTLMRECMHGQGVDRHLLGLKILALENNMPTPDLYTDPAYERR